MSYKKNASSETRTPYKDASAYSLLVDINFEEGDTLMGV
jgi:hypothetical protein